MTCPASASPRATRLHHTLPELLLLLPLAVAALWLAADTVLFTAGMPLQLNYVEGFNVNDALRLAKGEPLYGDPSHPPFVATVYPPIYPSVVAVPIALGTPGLSAARLVTFFSAAGIALVIAASGWRRTGWVAVAAASLFLLDPVPPFWQVVARPDCTAALLTVAGVTILETSTQKGRDFLAAAVFAAAILTKQSFIAGPAAVVVYFLMHEPKRALRFAGWLGAFSLGPALVLQAATRGKFFWHVVIGNVNQFSWMRALSLDREFLAHHLPQTAVLVVLLVYAVHRHRCTVSALWAAAACAVAAVSIGKAGSDLNYFIEPVAAVAMLVGREFPRDWFDRPTLVPRVAAAALTLAVLGLATLDTRALVRARRPLAEAQAPYRELMALVAAEPGVVVSDDACLLVETGKRVHLQPFVMTQLAEAGRWDQRPFLAELANGDVRMVVAQVGPPWVLRTRYTAEMRSLIAGRYVTLRTYRLGGEFAVMVPRPGR